MLNLKSHVLFLKYLKNKSIAGYNGGKQQSYHVKVTWNSAKLYKVWHIDCRVKRKKGKITFNIFEN